MKAKNETVTPTIEGRAPRRLRDAAALLLDLEADAYNEFTDCFSDQPAANYAATCEAIAQCRNALAALKVAARGALRRQTDWHRDCLAELESIETPRAHTRRKAL